MATIEKIAASEDLRVVAWRDVPTDDSMIGQMARDAMPTFKQVFLASAEGGPALSGIDLDRRAFVARKRLEHETPAYFPSLSARTLVYKGMLITQQLREFFPDLDDERFESALALVHSRFSTNTFPSWPLAHPYRMIAHNGEINTVMGNENWMRAREALLRSDLIEGLERAFRSVRRCVRHGALRRGARAVAARWAQPAALRADDDPRSVGEPRVDAPEKRAFYQFHSSLMEPWDGPRRSRSPTAP